MEAKDPEVIRSKKRKRSEEDNKASIHSQQVSEAEKRIQSSAQNINEIKNLLRLAWLEQSEELRGNSSATLALCRVFCRLRADGKLGKPKTSSKIGDHSNDAYVSGWLAERYHSFQKMLLTGLKDRHVCQTSLDVLLTLLAEEAADADSFFSSDSSLFSSIFSKLLEIDPHSSGLIDRFVEDMVEKSDQARSYIFRELNQALKSQSNDKSIVRNALSFLSNPKLSVQDSLDRNGKLLADEQAAARKAWLALLGSPLQKDQRKAILSLMTSHVLPWFPNPIMLLDFLTDCFDHGGATSLLALEGLFFLMQEKNLDYPDFYHKLYSLLDEALLHSKHRSRFFRLLETFMSSTHLPAALVASFIKRLSRLSLRGPPAGIVAVVPWVYNMLKTHPTCTFMIHREPRTAEEKEELDEQGFNDPFDMEEKDPMQTNAIDSSLWEIETLQSHYHPNVASLAKIISEQFTKQSYNLDDFLDHSYNSLLDSELGKPLKKTPIVEFQIPKTVFKDDNGDDHLEVLLTTAIATS